ncbi:unnamed protein product [Schistosoma mattheei]|uniref:Uncharacterized protein n=1 Tax=Schistosoma mattheei TaxID=31246 RepID=A0A3P8ETE5_9TREM|nr:unnamed protein product [Schistosoma mattheei]
MNIIFHLYRIHQVQLDALVDMNLDIHIDHYDTENLVDNQLYMDDSILLEQHELHVGQRMISPLANIHFHNFHHRFHTLAF